MAVHDRSVLAAKADRFRALHVKGSPVVLPNAWDAASARLVVDTGFPAVATTSAGVALSLGYEDHEKAPPAEMFAAVARIARAVDAPVTADLEAGYGLAPEPFVERLLEAGAIGCNLEDTDHARGGLVDEEAHAARLAAIKAAARARGVDIVLNARTDTFLVGLGAPEEQLAGSLRRARLYFAAGADCVYPILATDDAAIATLVAEAGGPINVLLAPKAPPLERLRELGVARVSLGPFLYRWAMEEARNRLLRLRGQGAAA